MDLEIKFQEKLGNDKNIVEVYVGTESGCSVDDDEYSIHITGFFGSIDINQPGGTDDASLIKDCIDNNIHLLKLPEEGSTRVILIESGEFEGYHWHKYYEILVADMLPE